MKKRVFTVFLAVILGISLVLPVGTVIAGPSKAGANEQLSKAPKLLESGRWNPDFLADAAAWYADHFFLRQELISSYNWLSAKTFGVSGSDKVILGKKGWLYYADTLGDYTGEKRLSAYELSAIAGNLQLMAEYVQGQGGKFLFVPTPNKNSLYPENMPESILPGERPWEQLKNKLDSLDVPYLDLFAAFGSEDEILYFSHDSHWNSRGAALAADGINAALGVESAWFYGDFQNKVHQGDLYSMLYPAFADSEEDPSPGKLAFTHTGSGKTPDSITIGTQGQGTDSLLVYRDSFGNLLYPYLADTWGEAEFSRSTVYDLTKAADATVIQLVERNLMYLATYVPVMPAPAESISLPDKAAGTVEVTASQGKAPQGHTQWKGQLPEAAEKAYILAEGTAYRAFLLKDHGFGANLPEGAVPEGVYYTTGNTEVFLIKKK